MINVYLKLHCKIHLYTYNDKTCYKYVNFNQANLFQSLNLVFRNVWHKKITKLLFQTHQHHEWQGRKFCIPTNLLNSTQLTQHFLDELGFY